MRRRSDELCDRLDRDGSGAVTIDDIRQFMTAAGDPLTPGEIEALLAAPAPGGERRFGATELRRLLVDALGSAEDASAEPAAPAMHAARTRPAALPGDAQTRRRTITDEEPAGTGDALRPPVVNPALQRMDYAVRGEVERRVASLAARLRNGERLAFDDVLMCNIGNPQALGQAPLTFIREVLALVDHPALLQRTETRALFAEDAIDRARRFLEETPGGTGAYSHSQGLPAIREAVARFIERRDGVAAEPDDIFLTDGASGGITAILRLLIARPEDTVLAPVPQYPIYSATCDGLNARAVGYALDEASGWDLGRASLERALGASRRAGRTARAVVVINPGNPTGRVLRAETLADIARFCAEHGLWLLADEVYQDNVYAPDAQFVSARRAVRDAGLDGVVPVVSFHSVSKGVAGECGRRGGYMELHGVHPAAKAVLQKLVSVGLCANVAGQIAVGLMADPPAPGTPSHARHAAERAAILGRLAANARLIETRLNALDGVTCQPIEGAMYAFPRIAAPRRAGGPDRGRGPAADLDYCLSLLERTGICAVPGEGFGMPADGFHLRLTILPPPERLSAALDRFAEHHASYMAAHG